MIQALEQAHLFQTFDTVHGQCSPPHLQEASARQALVQGEEGSLTGMTVGRPGVGIEGGILHMQVR